AEALQLRLAQEFGGEGRRVFEFELLHWGRPPPVLQYGHGRSHRLGWGCNGGRVLDRARRMAWPTHHPGAPAYGGVTAGGHAVASCAVRRRRRPRAPHTHIYRRLHARHRTDPPP